jgi:hypothetical protein
MEELLESSRCELGRQGTPFYYPLLPPRLRPQALGTSAVGWEGIGVYWARDFARGTTETGAAMAVRGTSGTR